MFWRTVCVILVCVILVCIPCDCIVLIYIKNDMGSLVVRLCNSVNSRIYVAIIRDYIWLSIFVFIFGCPSLCVVPSVIFTLELARCLLVVA